MVHLNCTYTYKGNDDNFNINNNNKVRQPHMLRKRAYMCISTYVRFCMCVTPSWVGGLTHSYNLERGRQHWSLRECGRAKSQYVSLFIRSLSEPQRRGSGRCFRSYALRLYNIPRFIKEIKERLMQNRKRGRKTLLIVTASVLQCFHSHDQIQFLMSIYLLVINNIWNDLTLQKKKKVLIYSIS